MSSVKVFKCLIRKNLAFKQNLSTQKFAILLYLDSFCAQLTFKF